MARVSYDEVVDENQAEYETFLCDHRPQILSCAIPDIYWYALFRKLTEEIFDAHNYFTLVYDGHMQLYPAVSCENGIRKDDPDSILLIDHAWTYEAEFARAQLRTLPGLAKRMASLMNLLQDEQEHKEEEDEKEEMVYCDESKYCNGHNNSNAKLKFCEAFYTDEKGNELPNENMVEHIFETMWKYNQTYQFQIMDQGSNEQGMTRSSLKQQVSFWYIMDELGSSIRHSDDPSFNVKCFFYRDRGISYSIMFPLQDLSYGDAVSRDFASGVTDPSVRAAALYPWKPDGFPLESNLTSTSDIDFLLFSNETRCREVFSGQSCGVVYLPERDSYSVFTDVPAVAGSIKEPVYRLVEKPEQADILWMSHHFKDFKSLQESGKQFVNQFPFENVLTCKDLLARVVDRVGVLYPQSRNCAETSRPRWFQESFNLNLELPQFVENFIKREKRNEDNIWIVKPWNLGRSLDTHVTRNLNHIIRLRETGPKIAFKYIHNPVLLEREDVGKVKFHFRYMAAVTSVDPLIVHVDKVFWIGCANKAFTLDKFDVYEKHFTTMNYRRGVVLKQIHHDEFPELFDKQNPGFKWSDVEMKVHRIIKELFEAASCEPPPRGIGHCKMSRAYYALDFMLKWTDDGSREMQPVLLEVNFNPDCDRLCKYHPDAFHHLFTSLFLGQKTPWQTVRL